MRKAEVVFPPFRDVFGSIREARNAGAVPKTVAHSAETPIVKASTRMLGVTSTGKASGPSDAITNSKRTPHHESATPVNPPSKASNA